LTFRDGDGHAVERMAISAGTLGVGHPDPDAPTIETI